MSPISDPFTNCLLSPRIVERDKPHVNSRLYDLPNAVRSRWPHIAQQQVQGLFKIVWMIHVFYDEALCALVDALLIGQQNRPLTIIVNFAT